MNADEGERADRLTGPSLVLGTSALVLVGVLAAATPAPSWGAVALFAGLFVFAENVDLEVPTGAGLSAGFMVVVAAMVVFATEGAPLGAVLVGASGGCFLPHLRRGDWRKVLYNSGTYVLAMGLGVGALLVLPEPWLHRVPLVLVGALLAALIAFAVDTTSVGIAMARLRRRPVRDVLATLFGWQWHVYPFALLGAGLGWLEIHAGAAVLALTVTPILVGRQAFASYLRAREADEAALMTLTQAVEAKDRYTAGHAERVAAYTCCIGQELGLRPRALERLRRAALMHDVGKLVVPSWLLNKPDRLTADEYERVRHHEEVTVALLGRIDFLAPVAPIALGVYASWHHDERRRPIERHIVAVADAYDAMTSTRAYRRALPQEVAFAELRVHAGTQFHPRCVEALIAGLHRRGLQHGAGFENEDALTTWPVAPPDVGPGSAGLGDLAEGRS